MENQPGQVISPQPEDNDLNSANVVSTPQTPTEIEQIDTAMQSQPQPTPEDNSQTTNTTEATTFNQAPINNPQEAPQPATEVDNSETVIDDNIREGDDSTPLISWQAAEPAESLGGSRSLVLISGVGALVSAGVFIVAGFNFSTIFSTLVIVLGIVALIFANRQPGHIEEYAIYPGGVNVGSKFYSYSELRAFSVVHSSGAENIELIPTKRFMPTLSVYLEPSTAEPVLNTLVQLLPHEEHQPDVLDKISRRLKM